MNLLQRRFAIFLIVAERRMGNFVVGLTNDDPNVTTPVYKQYHHVQYGEVLPVSASGSVSFPPTTEKYRFVIIQTQFTHNEALCLAEVRVFVR